MLVLTRKESEAVVINGNIIVKVMKTKGGKVKIGIDAPKNIHIRREELDPKGES